MSSPPARLPGGSKPHQPPSGPPVLSRTMSMSSSSSSSTGESGEDRLGGRTTDSSNSSVTSWSHEEDLGDSGEPVASGSGSGTSSAGAANVSEEVEWEDEPWDVDEERQSGGEPSTVGSSTSSRTTTSAPQIYPAYVVPRERIERREGKGVAQQSYELEADHAQDEEAKGLLLRQASEEPINRGGTPPSSSPRTRLSKFDLLEPYQPPPRPSHHTSLDHYAAATLFTRSHPPRSRTRPPFPLALFLSAWHILLPLLALLIPIALSLPLLGYTYHTLSVFLQSHFGWSFYSRANTALFWFLFGSAVSTWGTGGYHMVLEVGARLNTVWGWWDGDVRSGESGRMGLV